MSELRSKLIRLAHAKPELRGTLLPLLGSPAQGKRAGLGQEIEAWVLALLDSLRKQNFREVHPVGALIQSLRPPYSQTPQTTKAKITQALSALEKDIQTNLTAQKWSDEEAIAHGVNPRQWGHDGLDVWRERSLYIYDRELAAQAFLKGCLKDLNRKFK